MLIVNYHYCHDRSDPILGGVNSVTPDGFAKHVEALSGQYRPALPSQTIDASLCDAAEPGVLFTFDDGLRSVAQHAVPMLRAGGFSAIVFCCSLPILEQRVLDVHKIHLLQSSLGPARFQAIFEQLLAEQVPAVAYEDPSALGLAHMYRYDDEQTRRFKFLLNVEMPYDCLTPLLDRMFAVYVGEQREIVNQLYMSLDDMKRCQDAGVQIGIHTHRHRMLSRLSRAEQSTEIQTPLSLFETHLGRQDFALAYPYGVVGTWNDDTEQVMTGLGVACAFTLGRRHADPRGDHRFRIPRYDVNDVLTREGWLRTEFVRHTDRGSVP